jgi:hypothetical protein
MLLLAFGGWAEGLIVGFRAAVNKAAPAVRGRRPPRLARRCAPR